MTIQDVLGVKSPKVYKSKMQAVGCTFPALVLGVEIETEHCLLGQGGYETILSGAWNVNTDGSLRGNAFEFISKPMEMQFALAELADFFLKTQFTDANYTDRCSIHVHTNVTDMTTTQLASLSLTYAVVEEVLFEFVNHYNVPEPGKYRDTNIYCVPWNQCRMNHNMVQSMYSDVDYAVRAWQKYTALNISPARTIGTFEWRHMHGTSDMDKITKWLNLIGSIINYAKKTEFDDVVKLLKELNDTSAYKQFFTNVLGDTLPYTDRYAQSLADGVVNAKYSLIGLKDSAPVAKATRVNPHNVEINFDGFVAHNDQEPGIAGLAAAVDPFGAWREERVRQQLNAEPAAPVRRNRAIPRGAIALFFPLKRILWTRAGGNPAVEQQWGVMDNTGNRIDRAGNWIPADAEHTVHRDDVNPTYVQSYLGAGFWNSVDEHWRPVDANGDRMNWLTVPPAAAVARPR